MKPQDFSLLADATEEVAGVLEKLATQHPDVFESLGIRYPLADELGGYSGMLREHAQKNAPVKTSVTPPLKSQGQIADQAFSDYDFGDGVMVTDSSGWFYASDEHERTRKVYIETDGPAPRWQLTFTVRFDPTTGALAEAYAIDSKGQIWGSLPAKDNQKATAPQSAVEAQVVKTHPDFNAEDVRVVASLQSALPASQQQSAARAPDQDTPVHETDCYVIVKGEASDDEDEDVPGAYLVQLDLSRPVSEPGGLQQPFDEADHAEMATAVLNEFHKKVGIAVLDDFEVSVHLYGGEAITEADEDRDTGLVVKADFCGKVGESELPFSIPPTDSPSEAETAHPSM